MARAAILIVLGSALLLEPGLTGRALLVACGLLLIVLGIGELSSGEPGVDRQAAGRRPTGTKLLAASILVVIAATVVAVALVLPAPPITTAREAGAARLQRLAAMCDRRLDQVVFAATHNSYAAADEPGWLFANQRFGIARQLRDGIRALLIDIHLGAPDPESGRVRTDLEAEGSDRNKVARSSAPPRCAPPTGSSGARASASPSAGAARTSATRSASSGPSRSTSSSGSSGAS